MYTDLDEYSDKSNDSVSDITQRIAALESIYFRRLSSIRSEDTLEQKVSTLMSSMYFFIIFLLVIVQIFVRLLFFLFQLAHFKMDYNPVLVSAL